MSDDTNTVLKRMLMICNTLGIPSIRIEVDFDRMHIGNGCFNKELFAN